MPKHMGRWSHLFVTDGAKHNVVVPNATTEQNMKVPTGVKECTVTSAIILPDV
jgi:hypothetical protein